MSQNQNLSKNQRKRHKKDEKRKASGSPVLDNGGHCTPGHHLSPQSVTDKDFYQHSGDYVHTVMNPNSTPVLNIGQQVPYGFQIAQTPGTPNVFQTGVSTTPSWAIPLLEDIRDIKAALPKIDQIEKTVNSMCVKLYDMETKVTVLESKVNEFEKSISFIDTSVDESKTDLTKAKDDLKKMKKLCDDMQTTVSDYQKREETHVEKILDLEARSMRDNLIFYGLEEPQKPKQGEKPKPDNCEELVKALISNTLEIDTDGMEFNRIHRLGGDRAKKPRPIIVNFHRYADREKVRIKSYDKDTKNALKDLKQGIGVQMPQQYRDARKVFSEYIKAEENSGKEMRIMGNKLYVDGKLTKK
jgi:uncharacterized coiled-coil protein SlyX